MQHVDVWGQTGAAYVGSSLLAQEIFVGWASTFGEKRALNSHPKEFRFSHSSQRGILT
jgi:hypothetical protein